MAVKVFVSSTYIDLKDHRQRVITQLRRAGYHVDPMEDWTSDADEPRQFSLDRLRRLPGLCAAGRVPPGVRAHRAGTEHHPDGVRPRP